MLTSSSADDAQVRTGDLRVVFAPVETGDAVFVDTGVAAYLVDCGQGIDYRDALRSLGHGSVAGLVLTHAHMDHWTGLPEVLELMAADAWIARPGTILADELMEQQSTFEYFDGHVDRDSVLAAWRSLDDRARVSAGLPAETGLDMWDANAARSTPPALLRVDDARTLHHSCIVPVVRWSGRVAVFGADLDADDWSLLAPTLPRRIDLFQAPNHGGPPGRMERWVLDDHLDPAVVVVTDAQPCDNDHLDWYRGPRRDVRTLHERRTVTVTLNAAGATAVTGGLELSAA